MAESMNVVALTKQHIGAAGELLVQYKLLKLGIDSARLTTDAGVDLVAYAPGGERAFTVQVKSVLRESPAGGRGKLAVGWRFPHDTKAQLLAFVRLDKDMVWLMTREEAQRRAQQHTSSGLRNLYWYTVEDAPDSAEFEGRFSKFLLENIAQSLIA